MNKHFFILYEICVIFIHIKNENIDYLSEGYYEINSYLNNCYLSLKKQKLIISNIKFSFNIIPKGQFSYIIQFRNQNLGIDDNSRIIIYNNIDNIETKKYIWNIYHIKRNMYFIQNSYNNKLIEINGNYIKISNNIKINQNDKKYIFTFFKLFEKGINQNKYIKIINNEPIDVVIKYIDLGDKTLNRTGINQIYKDENCEELKYSIRSILQYIPWVRKIYILMPNEKVKFLKNEINEKIIYIKDKDILGFDSANSPSFSFNLFKMKKFGISKNFIYMDDDYFIGQKLKKKDFFYYDQKLGIVIPYIISNKIFSINKNNIFNRYYEFIKKKYNIHPHSKDGFNLELLCTQKFFIDYYNTSLISCKNTHNAFPENIDDLEKLFNLSKNYQYFNEMIYSKERFILSFYHQMFNNLYQLNVNHRKVHNMLCKYISIEKIKKIQLDSSLFVLNTGGNHEPIFRQKKILKNIMRKRFPFHTKYEIKFKENKIINFKIKYFIKILIIFLQLKILIRY